MLWPIAKFFSDRIRPDIAGDRLQFVASTENVVIETHHPKALVSGPFEVEGGPLLEDADKIQEI